MSIEEIKTDSKLMGDLGADSLDSVELVMALEEEFGLEISDEEATKLQTIQDILDYINSNKN